jgi:outer membrane protein OmpA-like peptidoglycan-associated protein
MRSGLLLLSLVFTLLLSNNSHAQARKGILDEPSAFGQVGINPVTVSPIYVGVGGAIGLRIHSLNIPIYNGSTFCGIFDNGTGIRPDFFFTFETPLSRNSLTLVNPNEAPLGWWVAPRIHYASLGGNLTTPTIEQAQVRNPSDGSLSPGTREHKLAASIGELGADLFMEYQVTPLFKLFAGPSVGTLLSATTELTDIVTAPDGTLFDGETPGTHVLFSGNIPNKNPLFASLTLGAGFNVPLTQTMRLVPEASFTYPLTSIRSDYAWHVMSARVGASLQWNVAHAPTPEPVLVSTPPVSHNLTASVKIVGVSDTTGRGNEVSVPTLRIEEFVSREAHPVLNYVFFDPGSADIPSRYYLFADKLGAESFQTNSLVGEKTLTVYYHTLNIIAKRMEENPSASLTLTGSNMNTGVETNATHLSSARAEAVKKYFTDIWHISPARVVTQSTNLPRNPSPADTPEGQAENRRVEILSTDPKILDPLTLEQVDRVMNPPILRVRTAMNSTSTASGHLKLMQAGETIHDFGNAQPVQDWKPGQKEIPRTDAPLVAMMDVHNTQGDDMVTFDSAMVKQITIQKKRQEKTKDHVVERYSLITFDFDRAELDDRSKRIVKQISENVTSRDSIRITGYTDLTGELAHNLTLSSERAKNVESALKGSAASSARGFAIDAAGEGEKNIVDNTLPEGRFLSRTVYVTIERPLGSQ